MWATWLYWEIPSRELWVSRSYSFDLMFFFPNLLNIWLPHCLSHSVFKRRIWSQTFHADRHNAPFESVLVYHPHCVKLRGLLLWILRIHVWFDYTSDHQFLMLWLVQRSVMSLIQTWLHWIFYYVDQYDEHLKTNILAKPIIEKKCSSNFDIVIICW